MWPTFQIHFLYDFYGDYTFSTSSIDNYITTFTSNFALNLKNRLSLIQLLYHCQKTRPRRNNIYTSKLLNNIQNTLNTLQRDIDLMWFTQTMGYVHTEIASPLLPSRKMTGYNLQQYRFTSSSRSHSLSHTITQIVYNATIQYKTIHSRIIMLFFYRGNTMGKYYG